MSPVQPLVRIPVGVVVERRRASSQWIDFVWQPVRVVEPVRGCAPWTQLDGNDERATFYAGATEIELYPSETPNYRDNLASDKPQLWVALRAKEDGSARPYDLYVVTADPAEGEGLTQAGNDLVEPVPMPGSIADTLAAFIAQHHVERVFFKRQRNRADPEALAQRGPGKKER
jgi:hypothetical protein